MGEAFLRRLLGLAVPAAGGEAWFAKYNLANADVSQIDSAYLEIMIER